MTSDNIFSGLKVVDLASFIAGPAAAVILSDFGADVIKVEPPTGDTWRIGYKIPPEPRAKDNYPWHLNNRNKRGLALDLKSPEARRVLQRLVEWADVLIVNTPHPAREKLKLGYDDVASWNPRLIYADVTGYGDNGPDAQLPGFDITAYWARSGLLSLTRDAGALEWNDNVVRPELRVFDHFAWCKHHAKGKMRLLEDLTPMRHRLRGKGLVQDRSELS